MSDTPGADLLNGIEAGATAPWPFRPLQLFRKVTAPFQRATARTAGPLPSGTSWNTASTVDAVTCLAEDLSVVYVDTSGVQHTLSDLIIENHLMLQQILQTLPAKTTP